MTTVRRADRPFYRDPRRRPRRYLPPQHGAWAMLVVPYLAAMLVAGARWVHLPLLGAWLAGYCLSYFSLQALKVRRVRRFRRQIMVYAAVTVPLAAIVVVVRPQVLLLAPGYVLLLAINAGYAVRRRERAVVNDLASVLQSSLIMFVVAMIADTPLWTVAPAVIAVVAYFTGTVLYVKTMIRERGHATYRRWSVGYHLAALLPAVWLGPWTATLFAWLLVRAWLLPRLRIPVRRVGLLEVINSLLLLLVIAADLT